MYLALTVTVLLDYVLGMLWYSPLLFGNRWMKLAHPGKKTDLKMPPLALLVSSCVVSHLMVSGSIYFIIRVVLQSSDFMVALPIAVVLCILVCGSQITHSVFNNHSFTWYLIDHGYDAACIFLGTFIIMYLA